MEKAKSFWDLAFIILPALCSLYGEEGAMTGFYLELACGELIKPSKDSPQSLPAVALAKAGDYHRHLH